MRCGAVRCGWSSQTVDCGCFLAAAAFPAPPSYSATLPAPALRSREAKKIFECALVESRRMSMSFITPEHIFLALLSVGDSESRSVMQT